LPPKRKILALLNPFGGEGRALEIYAEVKKMLDNAHLDITIVHTERKLHAFDLVKTNLKPGQYDGIITISGDGLLNEIVNGMM